MRNCARITTTAATVLALALAASGQTGKRESRPAKNAAAAALNEATLIRELKAMGMNEILLVLAEDGAKSRDLPRMIDAIDVFTQQIAATTDQDARDALIDRTIKLQEDALAVAGARDQEKLTVRDRIDMLKLRLARARIEGITKAEPYANRILYLWASDADRENVRKFTAEALKSMGPVAREIADIRVGIGRDEEAKILGLVRVADALDSEARYREAWMILYECIATPPGPDGDKTRKGRLQKASTMVADWVNPTGRKRPAGGPVVAQSSLLLAGIAAREGGDFDRGRNLMEQMLANKDAQAHHAQALFEIAHGRIDAGKDEKAGLDAVQDFRDRAEKLKILTAIAVDLQSTLLTSYNYDQLAKASAADPAKAQDYLQKAAATLAGFLSRNPSYRAAFESLIGPKYEGVDLAKVPASLRDLVIAYRQRKGVPGALQAAMAEWARVVEEARKTPRDKWDAEKVSNALHEMGTNYKKANNLKDASECFRLLAEWFPEKQEAKGFALHAVGLLFPLIDENRATAADREQQIHNLEFLLQSPWGSAPECRVFRLDLGGLYERAGRLDKALENYDQVRESDEEFVIAQSSALNIRGLILVRNPGAPDAKAQAAKVLDQVERFRAYIQKYNPKDKALLARARQAGMEADLMKIQILLEILNQFDKAAEAAARIPADWSDAPKVIKDRSNAFLIDALLKQGKLDEALALITKGEALSASAVQDIVDLVRARLAKMNPKTTDPAIRKKYVETYKKFVDQVYTLAEQDFTAQSATRPRGLPPMAERMYEFKREVATAYSESDERADVNKALESFQTLIKQRPNDAANVRGIARCQRKLGKSTEAIRAYNQLAAGLDIGTNPKEYWEANLEMLEYVVEVRSKDSEEMERVVLRLQQLSNMDPAMGGPSTGPRFEELREQASEALKAAPKPATSQPAPAASQPAKAA